MMAPQIIANRGEVRPSMQGLGLGLYTPARSQRRMAGRIDVKSDVEETRFTFTMPLAATN